MKIMLEAPPNPSMVFDIESIETPDVIKWGLSLWCYYDTQYDEEDNEIILYKPATVVEVPIE